MNQQMAQQQRMQQNQVNSAFGQFANFNQQSGGYGGAAAAAAAQGNVMKSMNNGKGPPSPADLFSVSANQSSNPASIFGQPNDPFANLSAQYSQQGNSGISNNMSYQNKGKPKDAFSDLGVLK